MTLRAAMVLTTIADPVVLEGYFANFAEHGHLEQVQVIVIPDRKTPPTVFLRCADLRNRGLDVACPTLEQQERTLRCLGFPPDLVPYDSDNRRNVGYLMAAEAGVDFLISIDDDNYCRHTRISSPSIQSFVASRSGTTSWIPITAGTISASFLNWSPISASILADFRTPPVTKRPTLKSSTEKPTCV